MNTRIILFDELVSSHGRAMLLTTTTTGPEELTSQYTILVELWPSTHSRACCNRRAALPFRSRYARNARMMPPFRGTTAPERGLLSLLPSRAQKKPKEVHFVNLSCRVVLSIENHAGLLLRTHCKVRFHDHGHESAVLRTSKPHPSNVWGLLRRRNFAMSAQRSAKGTPHSKAECVQEFCLT